MWGRGPCKHTPYITVKNKAGASPLLGQRMPWAEAWGQLPTSSSHSNTQGSGTPLPLGPGVHSSAHLTLRGAHTLAHTLTYTHTPPSILKP